MTTQKYIVKKIITDFLLINLVINAGFFLLTFKDKTAPMTLLTIGRDLLFGLVVLGLLASLFGFINLEKDLLKGEVNADNISKSKMYKLFPKSLLLRIVIMALIVMVCVYPLFYYVPMALGVNSINYYTGLAIKTISAGIAAIVVGILVTYLVLGDYDALQSWGR